MITGYALELIECAEDAKREARRKHQKNYGQIRREAAAVWSREFREGVWYVATRCKPNGENLWEEVKR